MTLNIVKKLMMAGLLLTLAACATQNELGQDASSILGADAKPGTIAEFTHIVGDTVLFETNQTSMNDAGKALLDRQYAWLVQYGVSEIKIDGHADERGTRQYNIALGAKRASSVKKYFVSLGYSGTIKTLSFGKERPVSLCDNISCWSQNRRAVTVVVTK